MSPAAAVKIQTPPDIPLTAIEQLQQLHSDRARLTGERDVLNTSSAKLRAAAQAEPAVIREIGEMGSAEIAAMTAWASTGCRGEQPMPDLKHRRVLAEKLAAAQAVGASATGAIQDVEHQIGQVNHQLTAINQLIEQAALDIMQDEMMMVREQYAATIEVVRTLAAKQLSLTSYFSGEGRRLIDRGDVEAGKRYLARAEALSRLTMADPGVTQGEIIAALNDHTIRAAALRNGGSPS